MNVHVPGSDTVHDRYKHPDDYKVDGGRFTSEALHRDLFLRTSLLVDQLWQEQTPKRAVSAVRVPATRRPPRKAAAPPTQRRPARAAR